MWGEMVFVTVILDGKRQIARWRRVLDLSHFAMEQAWRVVLVCRTHSQQAATALAFARGPLIQRLVVLVHCLQAPWSGTVPLMTVGTTQHVGRLAMLPEK